MKTKTNLTLRQIIDWAEKNNISLDTEIVCCDTNHERHFDATGIVYDTDYPEDFDGDDYDNELVGRHCYCKDGDIYGNVIVITDGDHYHDFNKVDFT